MRGNRHPRGGFPVSDPTTRPGFRATLRHLLAAVGRATALVFPTEFAPLVLPCLQKAMSGTPPLLSAKRPQRQAFPVISLFLRMRGFPGNHQKTHGMGISIEHVGEHPTVLTIFPVDFPDTGNFRQRRVRCRLGPPPYFSQ